MTRFASTAHEIGSVLPDPALLIAKQGLVAHDPRLQVVENELFVPELGLPAPTIPPKPHVLTTHELGLAQDSFWKGEKLTTGDHMSDCLAVWYGSEITDEIIAPFRDLDTKVRASIGQLAMVVLRRQEQGQHNSIVGTQYQVGRLVGDVGLYMELAGAQVKLPTEGNYRVVSLPSGSHGLVELPTDHPMVVHQMFDLSGRQRVQALPFHSIDLVNHQQRPTIDTGSINPDHIAEAKKPLLEIIVGTDAVKDFLETDATLLQHRSAMRSVSLDFLLRYFLDTEVKSAN